MSMYFVERQPFETSESHSSKMPSPPLCRSIAALPKSSNRAKKLDHIRPKVKITDLCAMSSIYIIYVQDLLKIVQPETL